MKVFIDVSGSTGNQRAYWQHVTRHVQELSKTPGTAFYEFDDTARQESVANVLKRARDLKGGGNTLISTIADKLRANDKVVIICDGYVLSEEVTACDTKLDGMAFTSVDVHFYKTTGQVNLSVAAPFTRNTKAYRVTVEDVEQVAGRTDQQIDLVQYYDQPEAFLAAIPELRKQVLIQNVGRHNEHLRNQILDLQKNLVACIAKRASLAQDWTPLRDAMRTDYARALVLMRQVIAPAADNTIGVQVADVVQDLVRLCRNNDFSFDKLSAPTRITRAAELADVPIEELPQETFDPVTQFECPITLDEDTPFCLVANGAPVLEGVDKSKLEQILTNPLFLLLETDLVQKVVARLDHLVGFAALRELFGRGDVVSPFTREPITSVLAVGLSKEHQKAANVALADILFGKKLVGQSDLWLAVLYFVIKERVPRLAEFVPALERAMLHRFRVHSTNLTLSGLPMEPLIKAPVDIGIWYCVVSPFLSTTPTNRLRDFGPVGVYLLDLVDLLEYKYERLATRDWMLNYRVFAWMMNQAKGALGFEWFKIIRAQYQNSLTLSDGTLILLDGPATPDTRPELPPFLLTLPLRNLLVLVDLVDVTSKTNAVYIPLELKLRPEPVATRFYSYKDLDTPDCVTVPLSERTYRPMLQDPVLKKHWSECARERYGNKYLSMYNYFIQFVHQYRRYPGMEEYIKFVASRQAAREHGASDTLPQHMMSYTKELFANYEKLLGTGFKDVSAGVFTSVTWDSMRETDREIMEGSVQVEKKRS